MIHAVDVPEGKQVVAFYSTDNYSRPLQCLDDSGRNVIATLVKPWEIRELHRQAVTCNTDTAIIVTDKPLEQEAVVPHSLYLVTK